jgi:hemolysin D
MGQVKVVEPLETGRVEDIRVGNGSLVRAGEVLVEFDRSAALADAEGARAELASAQAEILRRKTALLSAQSHRLDPLPAIDWPDGAAPALRERETRVLAADLRQLAATVAAFDAERRQKAAESDKLRETIATQKNLVATLQERVDMRTKLVEVKAGAKAAVIDATETLQYQITQEAKQEQDLVSATAGLEVIARNSDKAVQDFISDNAQKLEDAERRAEDVARLAKAQAELDHLTLRAPIAGRVQSSIITNVGQVVASGQEIMRIVPEDSGLEIQAYVRNRDIGFVSVGQEAVVKVESFPFTRYGSIHAHAHRQGRHSRARRQRDRGRSDAHLQRCRFRRRRAHAKSRVPGGAEARRRDDHGRWPDPAAHLRHGGDGRAQNWRAAHARISVRPAGRSRLEGDAGAVDHELVIGLKGVRPSDRRSLGRRCFLFGGQ